MIARAEQTPFVPGPIACARDVPLSEASSGQPVMGDVLLDWFRPLRIGRVTASIGSSLAPETDGVATESVRWVRTSGVVLNGAGEKLEITAEGERSWQNALLFTTADFDVPTDSVIQIKGVRFRVMKKADRTVNGFARYELLEDYAPAL